MVCRTENNLILNIRRLSYLKGLKARLPHSPVTNLLHMIFIGRGRPEDTVVIIKSEGEPPWKGSRVAFSQRRD
jgi:hypothetical protein